MICTSNRKKIHKYLGAILLASGIISLSQKPSVPKVSPPNIVRHESQIYDPQFFSQAYDLGQQYTTNANPVIVGGIIPHHLLAAPLIAGFFQGLQNQSVSTVILLSPNHYNLGPTHIATSNGVWTTVFGDLTANAAESIAISEPLFDSEHGIYGLTPFIKKTWPNVRFIPVVIKGGTPKQICDELVATLNKIRDSHTLILVSSDFSHYLPLAKANIYDQQTISAIQSFDVDAVIDLDHTKNTDSPESLYVFLKLMQSVGANHTTLIHHTNSAQLTNQPNLPSTTSYVTMYFY